MDEKKFGDIVFKMLAKFYQNVLLPKMATKEDLEAMAMKEDISRLETKIDNIAGIVTITKTNHEKRIRRLEKEAGIESTPITL